MTPACCENRLYRQIFRYNQSHSNCDNTAHKNLIGVCLAAAGKRVLLIDTDPQGSLSVSLGIGDADALTDTLATVMVREMNHSVYLNNPRS